MEAEVFDEVVFKCRERLYLESRINDASRLFSWCRKPSKLTRRLDEKLQSLAKKLNERKM